MVRSESLRLQDSYQFFYPFFDILQKQSPACRAHAAQSPKTKSFRDFCSETKPHPFEMTKRIKWHESNTRVNKHDTEYCWHLHNWSDVYQARYGEGIFSDEFLLEGTNGYTCKLRLDPTSDHPFKIIFSSTVDILTLGVTFSITNLKPYEHVYSAPFPQNSFSYYFHKSFDKNNRSYIFNDTRSEADTLSIMVKISLVTRKDFVTVTDTGVKYPSGQQLLNTEDSSAQVLSKFKELLDNKILADFTFIVRGKEFPAHKAVLAAHSRVFEKMFSNTLSNEPINHIYMDEFEPQVFETFLTYLYTGALPDLSNIVTDLISLADFYGIETLKTYCENHMLAHICEENVVKFFLTADQLTCSQLRTTALLMIRNSPTIFERTLREESPETLDRLKQVFRRDHQKNTLPAL